MLSNHHDPYNTFSRTKRVGVVATPFLLGLVIAMAVVTVDQYVTPHRETAS